jgi:hypothetical protein
MALLTQAAAVVLVRHPAALVAPAAVALVDD